MLITQMAVPRFKETCNVIPSHCLPVVELGNLRACNEGNVKTQTSKVFEGTDIIPSEQTSSSLSSSTTTSSSSFTSETYEHGDDIILNEILGKNKTLDQDIGPVSISAIDHDNLLENYGTHDISIVEMEANRIAQQALTALRESRKLCEEHSISTPTFTGRSGHAGMAIENKPRFGAKLNPHIVTSLLKTKNEVDTTNADLQGNLWNGQQGSGGQAGCIPSGALQNHIDGRRITSQSVLIPFSSSLSSFSTPANFMGTKESILSVGNKEHMIVRIHRFLQEAGGSAQTQTIINRFQEGIPNDDLALFKAMLKSLADFDKMRKTWKLKYEFA
eukprot:TRINITY_DN13501_c0_g1_i1.p1 TRINITY_DN13501_c0_g1~~TRINITY_DN13501_c0_g1_i1.p1  ORF type:complete len:331 (-),score=38.39 TRINITY_DN13501_c0_g1_i1:28-1020(-)